MPDVLFIMGVSGSGKSTIGKMLGEKMQLPFFDGDSYHPAENIKKMSKGIPLNDKDRASWLRALNKIALDNEKNGCIIACSALKEKYRDTLGDHMHKKPVFVFLKGSYSLIMDRLKKRKKHFMPPDLLASQFEALQIPDNALTIDIKNSPEQIVTEIIDSIRKL